MNESKLYHLQYNFRFIKLGDLDGVLNPMQKFLPLRTTNNYGLSMSDFFGFMLECDDTFSMRKVDIAC